MVSFLGFPKFSEDTLSQWAVTTATYTSGELACSFSALHSFYGWLLANVVTKGWKESKCPSGGNSWVNNGAATQNRNGKEWERSLVAAVGVSRSAASETPGTAVCVVLHFKRGLIKMHTHLLTFSPRNDGKLKTSRNSLEARPSEHTVF